jgi:hypothetical protein
VSEYKLPEELEKQFERFKERVAKAEEAEKEEKEREAEKLRQAYIKRRESNAT